MFWMVSLLDAFAKERTIVTQEAIYTRAGIAKDTLARFRKELDERTSETSLQKTASKIWQALDGLISDGVVEINEDLRPYLSLLKALFPDNAVLRKVDAYDLSVLSTNDGAVVKDELIRRMRLPIELNDPSRDVLLTRLQGFWFLLRPGSDPQKLSAENVDEPSRRISLALLNIVPSAVDKHRDYAFFKLNQGRGSNAFNFNGVVDPKGDTAHFVGGRPSNNALFAMVAFYNTDELDEPEDHLAEFSGVMLGLNSQTDNVASPFVCVYLPGSAALRGQAFDDKNKDLKKILGTMDRDKVWAKVEPFLHPNAQPGEEKSGPSGNDQTDKPSEVVEVLTEEELDERLDTFTRRYSFTRYPT